MTEPDKSMAEMFMQLTDTFSQMMESATGVKAMAIQQGFSEEDASRMGAASFVLLLQLTSKGAK